MESLKLSDTLVLLDMASCRIKPEVFLHNFDYLNGEMIVWAINKIFVGEEPNLGNFEFGIQFFG